MRRFKAKFLTGEAELECKSAAPYRRAWQAYDPVTGEAISGLGLDDAHARHKAAQYAENYLSRGYKVDVVEAIEIKS